MSTVPKTENVSTDSQNINATYHDEPVKLSEAAGDAAESFRKYAAQRPDVVALWAFGVGFVLGWKLKPW